MRYLAAPAPILLGWLSTVVPFRAAAAIMAAIYLVGAVALIWAPETKDQPLPEEPPMNPARPSAATKEKPQMNADALR